MSSITLSIRKKPIFYIVYVYVIEMLAIYIVSRKKRRKSKEKI